MPLPTISNTTNPPASAFSEPSEPSDIIPADKPKEQLTNQQEENPQVVVTASEGLKKEGKQNAGTGEKGEGNWVKPKL